MSFHKKLCLSVLSKQDVQSILLVSDIGEKLEKFATDLLMTSDQCNSVIQINTTDKLPIQGGQKNEALFVSLIVVLIDITNKQSLLSAKQSLNYVPVDFFLGRLIFIGGDRQLFMFITGIPCLRYFMEGLNIFDQHHWCMEPDEVEILAQQFDYCPVLWANISPNSDQSTICQQILRKLYLLSSNYSYCSSLL